MIIYFHFIYYHYYLNNQMNNETEELVPIKVNENTTTITVDPFAMTTRKENVIKVELEPLIMGTIIEGNSVKTKIPEKFRTNETKNNTFLLCEPFLYSFPEGIKVLFGSHTYVVVSKFYDDLNKMPQLESIDSIKTELVAGTKINQFGLITTLNNNINVKLSGRLNVRFPRGTKLQHPNSNVNHIGTDTVVHLTLEKDTVFSVFTTETKYTNIVNKMNKNNYDSELINNAKSGNLNMVRALIKAGANVRYSSDSPLEKSSENGHLEIVKFLVEKGANIHANDDCAVRYAARGGHLEIVKFLVGKGADIHTMDDWALCVAADNGHLEIVKFLLEKGANVLADNEWALKHSKAKGHTQVYDLLVEWKNKLKK
jgi:hypothetical protein